MAAASTDHISNQATTNQIKPGTLTRKWCRNLKKTAPLVPRKSKDRNMKNAAHEEEASTKKPFRFLDLPPEQRNQVYKYCLVPGTKFHVVHEWSPHAVAGLQPQVMTCGISIDTRMIVRKSAFNPHILRTCSVIHGEATSIFYGTSVFYLEADTLSEALKLPQSILYPKPGPITYIRHISLGWRAQDSYNAAVHPILARISNAVSLETLTFDATWIECFRTPETMAKAIVTLWKQVNRAKSKNDRRGIGIDYFSIKRPDHDSLLLNKNLVPGAKKDVAVFIPEFNKALKRIVTEGLPKRPKRPKNIFGKETKASTTRGTQVTDSLQVGASLKWSFASLCR
ncbi:unnamed protein product [Zymoseptoria tritici ST99CH_1A5]|uniref:DUF7730 domain-containing protein n=2 Tax=Zymoseptoria tritici TaxID=1047171 RepID=A0A1X7S7D0_ZYMT9|nr:unnamed protein product [Zymoseptoria tritici ST99CH_3D7]SMY28793.1 unnamed protein product [Zymoseptoria tritici ST99CH_1A5]